MSASALPRRTLRSGKEFSAFDLALAVCVDFDTTKCLQWRLSEQEHTGIVHEPEDVCSLDLAGLSLLPDIDTADDQLPTLSPAPNLGEGASGSHSLAPPSAPSPRPPRPLPDSLSAKERNKLKSRARSDKKRDQAQQASVRPTRKAVHQKRMSEAKSSYLEVYHDANGLPHSIPAWIGNRGAEGLEFVFPDGSPASGVDRGMGGKLYSQEEVDALTGTKGFAYIAWLGLLTIAILDSRRRVIALLGGAPQGAEDWAQVTERASQRMHERIGRLSVSPEKLNHRRAQTPYAPVSRGLSHGGGQTEPGELQQNQANTVVTDELLADPDIQRIVGWTNYFANLSWGWCAVTALGWFDPDLGGHLILWDLRLVIRFPPGSTIFIPSALIRHSNVPIRPHKIRSSFTQYTAGGLFRWIRNGFMTDDEYERKASASDKAARAAEAKTRWEQGMDMFSKIDEL
ncbi:hypothetical protein DFH08DRAFT_935631 [Mycena albidolilacea]|uniref:Uncharacterized protein n=1 Tax=Mycena albidolilacea TaxID=1033008 RepID=A0AAD7ESF4_9AGAR|nr:hypothetical protein DFH08DRAFT_935631 [Mycena albidolilacea]